jgi:NADP-dependent 3-hydroxy acid dehydrogenase YdfG
MGNLDGKVAWVTGGGSGIGRAGAEALAAAGARVAVSGRRQDALDAVIAAIADAGGEAVAVPLDVMDADAVAAAHRRIVDDLGTVDILVNSAGLNVGKRRYREMSVADWHLVIDANLNGSYHCIHAVLPDMRRQRDGLIVNISSWAGRHNSFVAGPAYGAAKHAVSAMSATINIEEGRYGIRCCCIEPAEVATEILDRRPVPVSQEDRARMLQAEDLGATIRFVAEAPAHVCFNDILISPTWNRAYIGGPDQFPGPPED